MKGVINAPVILLFVITLLLAGCVDLPYYLHSMQGQWSILQKSQDIGQILQDGETDPELVQRLELVSRIRQYAHQQLHLPESGSYTQYADLGRRYVLKNLFATDEFSISLQRWCYPVVGCAGYRGYFDDQMLEQYKAVLQQQGKDVYVAWVPAYSTLGWFDDPVLNTFVDWPEYRLAGLIFHELAHQQLYIQGDSRFNESFAVAVQQSGIQKWLQDTAQYDDLLRYQQHLENRQKVVELIEQGREQLRQLYRQEPDTEQKRLEKQRILQDLKLGYSQMSATFTVPDGFKNWFSGDLNNAKLASMSTYHSRVQAFRNLLQSQNGDYPLFYQAIERVSRLNADDRERCLDGWMAKQEQGGLPGNTGYEKKPPDSLCNG